MSESKKKVYKLYAFRPTEAIKKIAEKERFCMITPRYVLIYAESVGIIEDEGFLSYIIIGESEKGFLTDRENEWLLRCNLEIIAEETAKNDQLILQNMEETLAKLEKALDEEASQLTNGE